MKEITVTALTKTNRSLESIESTEGRKKVQQMIENDISAVKNFICRWRENGEIVNELKASPNKYGKGIIEQAAKAMGKDSSVLYRASDVAIKFTQEDVEEICERRSADNKELSWSHMQLLAAEPNDSRRGKLLARFWKKSYTVRELSALLARRTATTRKTGGLPATPQAGAKLFLRMYSKIHESQPVFDDGLIKLVREAAPEQCTPKLAAELKEVRKNLVAVQKDADRNLSQLDKAINRVERVREKNGNGHGTVAPKKTKKAAPTSGSANGTTKKKPVKKRPVKKTTAKDRQAAAKKKAKGKKRPVATIG